jgi:hypothetical protein
MRAMIVLICLVLGVGCAKSPVGPDWLTAEPADYSAARYLTGRGQGETAGLARDRARADLAKVFEVAVRESSSDSLQWLEGSVGKDGLQSSISRDIHLQTSQILNGVEIVQTWRGENGGDYHALAVLDRLQAGNRLRAEIAALDAETAQNIIRARSQDALPEKISAAYNALYAQLQRRHPQKMLRIVDGTGLGLPPKYSLAELKSDFESLLDRWQIGLAVGKDELGGTSDLLAGALGNAGIRHLADGTQAEYLLRADLDSDKFTAGDGWNWVRGTLRVSLLETASGNVIGSHQWSYKSSALQPAMAETRARDELADLLARDLLKVLVGLGDIAGNPLTP